jgi:bifunctional enzyme CysN/CysC
VDGISAHTGHHGTLWLTGLPGAGKTTLALAVERELRKRGCSTCLLDGDELRRDLDGELGYTRRDRGEQARRAAHAAARAAGSGTVAIVALVSPYAQDRGDARAVHDELGLAFFEIWVHTPLSVCEQRDPKGLYARARAGQLDGLTGLDDPYEPPSSPDLRVPGYGPHANVVAQRLVALVTGDRETTAVS